MNHKNTFYFILELPIPNTFIMPKITVTRSITIYSPIKDVYSTLSDLNHWVNWSPWLVMEEGVDVNISGDGKFYSWKGTRVGEADR